MQQKGEKKYNEDLLDFCTTSELILLCWDAQTALLMDVWAYDKGT